MLSLEQIKQFIATVVIPPLAGALATWLFTSVHFLSIFHITADQTAKAITELAVFGVTAGLAWLASHHILLGNYTPDAKAARGRKLRLTAAATEYSSSLSGGLGSAPTGAKGTQA